MDPEDKKKLDRLLELAEENKQYVHQVRRAQKTAQMWKAIYWVIVIAIAASSWYALKPYLGKVSGLYSAAEKSGFSTSDVQELQDLYAKYKNQLK